MKCLYLEKSTGSARSGDWAAELDLDGVGRIVVGTGPGSFAGIRAAIAFAQGFAIARGCEVLGLPKHIRVMGLLPMGYPAEDAKPLDLHFQYRDMDDMVQEI